MVAISFIVFDLETIFPIPWAVQMRELGWSAFLAMSMFVGLVLYTGLFPGAALEFARTSVQGLGAMGCGILGTTP